MAKKQYQYKSEASVVDLERGVKPTDIPNGVVIRGPAGEALLVDYKDDGKMGESGTVVTIGKWLSVVGDSIPADMVILVHSVKGSGEMLLKSLEVNRIMRDGERMTVKEAAKEGVLPKFVATLRETYLQNLKKKEAKCANTADSTGG